MIAIYLSKQQVLDADPKPIQQINFNVNLSDNNNKLTLSIIEVVKETILDSSQGMWKYCNFILF